MIKSFRDKWLRGFFTEDTICHSLTIIQEVTVAG